MSAVPVLNERIAEINADAGMATAVAHANQHEEDWSATAQILFKLYASFHPEGFMTEDVRLWACKLGFPEPPDNRAWGVIAKNLAKNGYIKSQGFDKQKSANCHGAPKTVWRKG